MLEAVADVGIGREVEDEIGALHGGGEAVEVEQIAAYEAEARGSFGGGQKLRQAGGEVVVPGNLVTFGQQAVRQMAGDEAGASCDETMH